MANRSTTSTQFPTNLSVFKGENYQLWVAQIKVIFRFQDVVEILNDGISELEVDATEARKTTHKDQSKKDGKALFLIHQYVDCDVFEKIIEVETTKGAWEKLKSLYDGDEKLKKVKLQTLRKKYEMLQMKEDEYISAYFS